MNTFLKKNWKPLAILACVTGVCIVAIFIFNYVNNSSKISQTADGSSYGLPANVTLATPIMYDFVNGSLGLNEDYVDMVQGNKVFIATRQGDNKCYVSYISYNEYDQSDLQKYLPRFSPAPVLYEFAGNAQKEAFLHHLTEEMEGGAQVVQEGEYTFYIADYGKVLNEFEGDDFDLAEIINKYKPGKMQQTIDDGMGIPTYIIREKCDLQALKNISPTTDFTNSFWDNLNFKEQLKCFKKGSTTDYVVLSPTLAKETSSSTEYYPSFAINNAIPTPTNSLQQIDEMLAQHGFESISDTIARGAYSPEKKGTVDLYD